MKYTQIPTDTFKELQLNAGILVDDFTVADGTIGNIIGATSGGVNFNSAPTFSDWGEDIDNCPKNTMELKKLDSYEITLSGTFVTVNASSAKMLVASADTSVVSGSTDITKITPRKDLSASDFDDMWWIGDYSDKNDSSNAGFIAIHMMNTLSTGGFQIQSSDKAKGTFSFTFTAHYSMEAQSTVPFEIYIKSPITPSVTLDKSTASITGTGTTTISATTVPAGETVTWTSSDTSIATVSNGTVTGKNVAGTSNIVASITVDGVAYTATCVVTVTAQA